MKLVTRDFKVKIEGHEPFIAETECPQYESVAEAVEAAGSEESFLSYVNAQLLSSSRIPMQSFLKTKGIESKSVEEISRELNTIRKNAKPGASTRITKETKLEFADATFAIFNDASLSVEEKNAKIQELIARAR